MPGQPCGRDLPLGWLHLQLKNLGSPIRFLLDGFTMCAQSILPEKGRGRDAAHSVPNHQFYLDAPVTRSREIPNISFQFLRSSKKEARSEGSYQNHFHEQ
ncbi:hypothetical protein CEXT_341751 [Caerostris extrusa]|uniref:Uncharacterized protein n=1 Tax=Caerostris extrusa TaxID=172846 RepID=A0AAV4QRL9_CAEEX|nr:hypothetical protein CEXT_341751 [Caerostris extrusa]